MTESAAHGPRWPSKPEYAEAVQDPATAFADPGLARGVLDLNRLGMPRTSSGRNAVVFRLLGDRGPCAVRCMTREPVAGARRYDSLSRYVETRPCAALTPATWLERGILVGGAWWPVVLMPWVPGDTLDLALARHLDEPRALRHLAANWRVVLRQLAQAGLGHGDLQHGNVLVDDELRLQLVDLDGVWVPDGQEWPRADAGHPDYRHPREAADLQGVRLDAFPASVIFLSALAVAADPGLWQLHTQENLIFRETDFAHPGRTPLWERLGASPDPRVATMSRRLSADCARAPGQSGDPEQLVTEAGPSPT
ncbi:hypothetical protein [Streptomyces aureoverticillatus]|uniref:hypothetical protein n=1 Tax=Streptomyces aureoverticillatus TaxID=66871 RepID=UPI0013DA6375|nr:hypothetical protein [Streptomyces aureoverticillatus]QIB47564.1 hypothetical protein G3H79_35300 [Streptomyces aureoverticillatus]